MSLLPHVTPEMQHASFWLQRAENANAALLTHAQITQWNACLPELTDIPNVVDLPDSLDAAEIRDRMTLSSNKPYYMVNGKPFTAGIWDNIYINMAAKDLPSEMSVRFGLVTQRTSVRTFPTKITALKEPDNLPLDRFQETTVDIGWPVAVVHTSADGQWYFALTPMYWGWIKARHVALASRHAAQTFSDAEPFAVAARPWADIAMLDGLHLTAQMGTRLPLIGRSHVAVPRRSKSGMLKLTRGAIMFNDGSWSRDYQPPALTTVLNNAFSMLGEQYSWGGMRLSRPGRDCSRFVRDVWATTGVLLPRNSGQQERVGIEVAAFNEDDPPDVRVLKLKAVPPGALLFMPGHVMLYLGMVGGIPFAIHNLWQYKHPEGPETMVGQVAVSALPVEPGQEGKTLLERLTTVRQISV